MLNEHKRRKAVKHTARRDEAAKVSVKNSTGSDLQRGSVIEFTDALLSEIKPDYPWFDGDVPDLTNVGWGITISPVLAGDMGKCWILGVCPARVVIADESHQYANRVDGGTALLSAEIGSVKIIAKPAGGALPEERVCWVQLMDESGGDVVDTIQINTTSGMNGDIVEPEDVDGAKVFSGKIRRTIDGVTYADAGNCWLQFTMGFPADAGNVLGVHGEYYSHGKFSGYLDKVVNEGEEGETHDERPLYVAECPERSYFAKVQSPESPIAKGATGTARLYHSHNMTDSGIDKADLFAPGYAIPLDLLCIVSRVAGRWCISPMECPPEPEE
ncbi:hypothetical protein NA78x_001719 [Anatilimnocola sp. NA78]|uniref:hypothetical protein n=1 Tax=Anatilimnocola sp. NA78 TaxID=3415683 RepID=UPI003CE4EDDC